MSGGSSTSGKSNYNEASEQAWPGFVDILSSTILVLCFALLIMVLLLSITKITSSTRKESNESSPSATRIESDVIGDYRLEFQKLAIVANPSLVEEKEVQSEQPSNTEGVTAYYTYKDATPTENPQEVQEVGDSTKEVHGDIPKVTENTSLLVLKTLIMTQRDVIDQQRKVIDQKNTEIQNTVREYSSLLTLVTKSDKEIEELRAKIVPKDARATFDVNDEEDEKLTGASDSPKGESNYALNPTNNPKANIELSDQNDGLRIAFQDNASFLRKDNYDSLKERIGSRIEEFKEQGVVLEAMVGKNSLSGAEDHRIAVNRLLIIRSLLLELGVPANKIKLKTIKQEAQSENGATGGQASSLNGNQNNVENQDVGYGWITIKANS